MASPTEQLRAAPALLPPLARPPSPGCSPEVAAERSAQLDALRECLRAEQARAAAELERLAEQQAAVQAAIQEGCAAAEEQHGNIVDALGSLATRLAALAPDHGSTCSTAAGQHPPGAAPSTGRAPPLLSTDLPDAYARACTALLEALGEYVQHHLPGDGGSSAASGSGSGAGLPAAQAHRRRELELAQLQGCQCKSERLRVAEEAEVARWVTEGPAGAGARV